MHMPNAGEGAFICRSCGNWFNNHNLPDENWLLDLIRKVVNGDLFVKCPKCESLQTERNPFVCY